MVATKKTSAKRKVRTESFRLAPAGSEAPSSEAETAHGKSIFLFADGTGNSSAKLFKTNVWRMYEAIDLGLASPGNHVQIGYYDNGVGTSNFRPLALLGGIFGIGLKANVLRLYGFLCRNYQPNDRIYLFGFSRGAFTIRLLVGLITSQGILQSGDADLSYQIRDAYRAFCLSRPAFTLPCLIKIASRYSSHNSGWNASRSSSRHRAWRAFMTLGERP
jgi:uncharacterized protein (DUF2235 family)